MTAVNGRCKVVLILCLAVLISIWIPKRVDAENSEPVPAVKRKTAPEIRQYSYKIINTYPHDPDAFTQGLVFENGFLYESTGLRGHSTLRKVELKTGRVLRLHALPADLFGEGIATVGDRIVQLTWKSRIGLVYDRDTFTVMKTFRYATEGWGLAQDGRFLYMSDGTPTIRIWDPQSYREIGRIDVRDGGVPVPGLNELEYADGLIYANVWPTENIARIDPATGSVVAWIRLKGLLTVEDRLRRAEELNGIAFDNATGRFFVTGKRWSKLFEVQWMRAH